MTLSQGFAEPEGVDAGMAVPLSKQRLRVWLRLLNRNREILGRPVSYTHLTLPTTYTV